MALSEQYYENASEWEKQRSAYLSLMEKKQLMNQQTMGRGMAEQAASEGWLDRGIQGASMGAMAGPKGAIIGGILGALTGVVEGGIAGEHAGRKNPWADALIPININPTAGAPSVGAGSTRAAGGIMSMLKEHGAFDSSQPNQPTSEAGGQGNLVDPLTLPEFGQGLTTPDAGLGLPDLTLSDFGQGLTTPTVGQGGGETAIEPLYDYSRPGLSVKNEKERARQRAEMTGTASLPGTRGMGLAGTGGRNARRY